MSSPNKVVIAAALLAVSAAALPMAPAALADPLVFDPSRPGYHPGHPGWYVRYERIPDWFERRDTVTLQAGDAVAANQAMQMRDPWPPYVANRNIQFNGVVMDRAIDRYKAGEILEPEAVTTTTGETQ
jgi:hypothetical protein